MATRQSLLLLLLLMLLFVLCTTGAQSKPQYNTINTNLSQTPLLPHYKINNSARNKTTEKREYTDVQTVLFSDELVGSQRGYAGVPFVACHTGWYTVSVNVQHQSPIGLSLFAYADRSPNPTRCRYNSADKWTTEPFEQFVPLPSFDMFVKDGEVIYIGFVCALKTKYATFNVVIEQKDMAEKNAVLQEQWSRYEQLNKQTHMHFLSQGVTWHSARAEELAFAQQRQNKTTTTTNNNNNHSTPQEHLQTMQTKRTVTQATQIMQQQQQQQQEQQQEGDCPRVEYYTIEPLTQGFRQLETMVLYDHSIFFHFDICKGNLPIIGKVKFAVVISGLAGATAFESFLSDKEDSSFTFSDDLLDSDVDKQFVSELTLVTAAKDFPEDLYVKVEGWGGYFISDENVFVMSTRLSFIL